MLSGNAEVSCFNKDFADANDNFVVECEKQEKGSVVTGASSFFLRNEKLNLYLYTSKYNNFHEGNCGSRCPIIGQLEVSGVSSRNANGRWKVESGIFVDADFDEEKPEPETKWVYDADQMNVAATATGKGRDTDL